MGILADPRHEIVAQELARGKSPAEASRTAGYRPGTSFASNARKRAQRDDIKRRIHEINTVTGVLETADTVWLQRQVIEAILRPVQGVKKESDHKAYLELHGKIIGAFAPEKHEHSVTNIQERLDAAIARDRESNVVRRQPEPDHQA